MQSFLPISGTTLTHPAGSCCAVLFSLIIEHGSGHGPRKNISDVIITLAACKMNQIVLIRLTNGLRFNCASTLGSVSVCLFDIFIIYCLSYQLNFAGVV